MTILFSFLKYFRPKRMDSWNSSSILC